MIPVVAIVGRPNVGKSTLFNQFTCSRDALVGNLKGITRDRQYGHGRRHDVPHIFVDTGGLFLKDTYRSLVESQVKAALNDASHIFFVVDAKAGLMPEDLEIASQLRMLNKPLYLLVNKIDAGDADCLSAEFYQVGIKEIHCVSAEHNRGLNQLMAHVLDSLLPSEEPVNEDCGYYEEDEDDEALDLESLEAELDDLEDTFEEEQPIRVAIIGRPNVGKSTLTNRMLGEERMVVYDEAGTTIDSIESELEHFGKKFILIDTAGVRKKANIKEKIEKFSIVKTLQAVQSCHVALIIIDAQEGLGEQDLKLIHYTIEAGKSIILCLNKWDNLETEQKQKVKQQISQRLRFADFIKVQTISALHGTNVGLLYKLIARAYKEASKKYSTAQLTEILYQAQMQALSPLVHGRRIKLRYAHSGGHFPPTVVIHGSQAESVPPHYQRYLMHYYMKALKLRSTPVKLVFKTTANPYKHKVNELTPKQLSKRRRMIKHRIEKSKRKRAKAY